MARTTATTLLVAVLAAALLLAPGASAYPKRDPPRQANPITGTSSKNAPAKSAAAAAPAKTNGVDCAAVLHDAAKACSTELKLVDSKAKVASASSTCCAAAARIYSPAFATACACQADVLREAARLTAARVAAQAACPALKTAAAAIPACPSAAASASASANSASRNGTTPAAAPLLPGATGDVCKSEDTTGCATKCTSSTSSSTIARTQTCANRRQGNCEGLGVNGATTGITRCGKGKPVDDPSGQGRKCFKCCTVRFAPTGSQTTGRNACPRSGGGGGGGGGGCFPGEATVTLESGKTLAMRDLKIGDRVLSADPKTGELSFQDVYFFGHMVAGNGGQSEFVRLEVDSGAAAMELTSKHLLPTLPGPVYKRAQDVRVGDVVLVVDSLTQSAREAKIAKKTPVVRSSGLYAPITLGGGHIVVSSESSSAAVGVVASVHSDWILDPLFEKLGRVSSLHAAYERTHGALLRALYRVVGPAPLQAIAPVVSALANGEAPAGAGATAVRALAAATTATTASRKA